MNRPNPAIVAQHAVRRLPRLALLLLCLAYVLPGFIGREPWRSADITAFGYMLELASGHTPWLAPKLLGQAPDFNALLPYWLGAWAIQLAPSWISADAIARLPFILLLTLTLMAVWSGVYYLARSPGAQPVAFAFGGEASAPDYARAMADGGLLAFLACLGLAQLSHETTPALVQLCCTALSFYAVAAMPYRRFGPVLAGLLGLTGLTLGGAPALALFFGVGSALLHALDRAPAKEEATSAPRWDRRWILGMLALNAALATLAWRLQLWHWHIALPPAQWPNWRGLLSLLTWFTWPAWPLAFWTLWRWRRQWINRHISRHISLPLMFASITVLATLLTPAGDRALLLALPSLATLAAFALPTLERSVSALIDWFTLLFFTTCALVIWVVWIAVHTGFPPHPAANVARLAPEFQAHFSVIPFILAMLATLAWIWLVQWRAGRHRAAIWKSLVLPAGGATLCWFLLTTLWMPLLDYGRSYGPLARRVAAVVQDSACVETLGITPGLHTALHYHTHLTLLRARKQAACGWLIVDKDAEGMLDRSTNPTQWTLERTMGHPREGEEDILIFRRSKR